MIVVKVRNQNAFEMGFVEYDHVVQTFPANGADHSFAVRVLPGCSRCDGDLVNTHAFDTLGEVVAVDSIAVSDKESRRLVEREGINDLLSRPFGAGICRNVEMNNVSPVMPQNDENIQHAKRRGRQCKEVAGRDIPNVIVEKRTPSLGRWLARANHVLGYRPFGHMVAQQKQFGQDSGCAPGWVFAGHAPNQVTNLVFDARASGFTSPCFSPPVIFESLTMPSDYGFRLYDDES